MRTVKILTAVLGALLMSATLANAAVVDVIEYPTGYFTSTYTTSSPYYRWYNEDWGWTHNPIGGSITSATLNIGAWDVDAVQGEVDEIYAYDEGAPVLLGTLTGSNNAWAYSTFAIGSNFYNEIASGLQIWMDIDTTHNYQNWAVLLSKSALSIDGGQLPNPEPGHGVVPEPATLSLLGLGLAGLVFKRKKA